MDTITTAAVIIAATVALVITAMLISSARRRKSRGPARHAGSYVPRKARREIRGATDHNAASELAGPRSKRFPELEKP